VSVHSTLAEDSSLLWYDAALLGTWTENTAKRGYEAGTKKGASDQLVADEPKGTHVRGPYEETDEAQTRAVWQRITALHVSYYLSFSRFCPILLIWTKNSHVGLQLDISSPQCT